MCWARVRDGRREPRELVLARLDAPFEGAAQARLELVEPLRALAQLHAGVTALQPVRQHREVPLLRSDSAPRHVAELLLAAGEALGPLALVRNGELGRLGGRRRAQVRDEVRDREVDLVPDADDDGQLQCGDRARDDFFVERPKVFERAAAASQDQHVAVRAPIGERERSRDLVGRAGALHGCRVDQHGRRRKPPAQRDQHVAQRGARRRGDHADPARQLR